MIFKSVSCARRSLSSGNETFSHVLVPSDRHSLTLRTEGLCSFRTFTSDRFQHKTDSTATQTSTRPDRYLPSTKQRIFRTSC